MQWELRHYNFPQRGGPEDAEDEGGCGRQHTFSWDVRGHLSRWPLTREPRVPRRWVLHGVGCWWWGGGEIPGGGRASVHPEEGPRLQQT